METIIYHLPMKTIKLTITLLIASLLVANAQTTAKLPATAKGYAQLKQVKMYYEVYGEGSPIVLLHGAYMTLDDMMRDYAADLSKTHKVIIMEFQGHGRTPDVPGRDITYEGLADDVAELLKYLKIERADVLGYSLGGGVALQVAIRHPDVVNKLICISGSYSDEGLQPAFKPLLTTMTVQQFDGTPFKADYERVAPNKNDFAVLFEKLKKLDMAKFNWENDYKQIKKPMLLIFGDGDMVTIDHIASMLKLVGGNQPADLGYKNNVHLAILPNTSHVGMMKRLPWISPMLKDFLN